MQFKFKMDVLLYSKFSNASKQLILQLQQTPDILETITVTCVDNKMIRAQILADEKIKFKYLPCFIRLNDDTGIFDIYEGKNAFDFFTSLQQQIKNVQHDAEIPQQSRLVQSVKLPSPSPRPLSREKVESIESVESVETIETPKQMPVTKISTLKQKAHETGTQRQLHDLKRKEEFTKTQNTSKKAPNKITTSFQPKKMTFTPIEELDFDSDAQIDTLVDINDINEETEEREETEENEETEEREEKEESSQKTQKEQKKGISTYTHIPKNKDTDFSEREIKSKQAETNAGKNTGSILSKAMRMQKERGS